MSQRMIDMLMARSSRERLLLGVVVFVVLPLAVALGWLLPLSEQRAAATRAQAEALALQGWVMARVGEKQALARNAPQQEIGPPIGSGGIEQGLVAAQLRRSVSELGAAGQGGIELRFDEVDFMRLSNWLSASHPGWGYEIESFRLDALNRPGVVAAALTLTPRSE